MSRVLGVRGERCGGAREWHAGVGWFCYAEGRAPLTLPLGRVQSNWAADSNPKRKRRDMLKARKPRPTTTTPDGPGYNSSDVARICGVSLRQLQWWDERNVVSPRQDGHKRIYMAEEVVEISVIAELRRKGFSLQKIRRVLRFLQKDVGKRLAEALANSSDMHLLTDGKTIYLEETPNRVIDVLKSARQPMFLVCVTDQVKRLTALVASQAPVTERKPARSETVSPSGRKVKAS